jgi:hypothetical protein
VEDGERLGASFLEERRANHDLDFRIRVLKFFNRKVVFLPSLFSPQMAFLLACGLFNLYSSWMGGGIIFGHFRFLEKKEFLS